MSFPTNCPPVDTIPTFLGRFQQYRKSQAAASLASLHALLGRFSAAQPQLQAAEAKHDRLHAPEFNVFRILRLGRREVLAHTPMLGELLNPHGHHGQDTLFLEAFFEEAAKHGLQPPRGPVSSAAWRIRIEQFCGSHGNIDLIISSPSLGYLLVIENKIDAQEGHRQLERYHEWMETQHRLFSHRQLVFLTPTGRAATTHAGAAYVRLSYHEAVSAWLRSLDEKIEAPPVRQLVRQYLEVVEFL